MLLRIKLFFLLLWPISGFADCDARHVHLRGDWGQAQIIVEIADNDASRAQGLMGRDHLAPMRGMLFVYPNARPVGFWMKNTLIPLDIMFFSAKGELLNIHHNTRPHDETVLPSRGKAQFVLEIAGGWAQKLGLDQTTQLSHPTLDQKNAVFPCQG